MPVAAVLLSLLSTGVVLLVLYTVIRAAVRDGIRQAVRPDLLRADDPSSQAPRGPRSFREAQADKG